MTSSETKKLDTLFSKKVRELGYCERCGKTEWLNTCHIHSRRYRQIRWSWLNVLCLCAGCHRWSHDNPMEFADFVKTKRRPKELEELIIKKREIGKLDYETVLKQIGGKSE